MANKLKLFMIKGLFRKKRVMQNFQIEISAENQEQAQEKTYCLIGSRYKCPRRFIKLETKGLK